MILKNCDRFKLLSFSKHSSTTLSKLVSRYCTINKQLQTRIGCIKTILQSRVK